MTTVEELLPHLRSEFIFAQQSASPDCVRTLMVVNGISRVPVMQAKEPWTCCGIVRMRSFFERPKGLPPTNLEEVLSKAPPEIDVSDPLFLAVERLRGNREVLIRNRKGLLTHILTPRGLADWWHAYSRPFLVLEELETSLREMLRPFEGDRLHEAANVHQVEQLNPLQYRDACCKFWHELPVFADLDRSVVLATLTAFAEQRNALMHFRLKDKVSMEADLRRFNQLHALIRTAMRASSPASQPPGPS